MSSACSRRWLRRAFSFRRRWFSSVSGLAVDLRPRFLGVKASNSPCSFWRRQVVRWDEYNPSRRSNPPMAPSSRQASAWATIERLYSAVNWRRLGFSGTSGLGIGTGAAPPELAAPPLRSGSLRSPSLRCGAANSACLTGNCLRFDLSTELDSFSALYSN